MACVLPTPGPPPTAPAARGRRGSVSAEVCDSAHMKPQALPSTQKAAEVEARIRASMQRTFLLKGLDEVQEQAVVDALEERRVAAGDVIITQGEMGDNFYLIERGTFSVTKAGAQAPVFTYDGCGAFGELALMYQCPRQATVTAASDGVLWALPRPTFRALVVMATAAQRQAHEEVLQRMEVFRGLDDQQRSLIADCLSAERYAPGEHILREGEPITSASKFYIIERGAVECFKVVDGERRLVSSLGPGDFFGEWALLDHLPNRMADCVAALDPEADAQAGGSTRSSLNGACVKLLALQRDAFERLMGPLERSGLSTKIAEYKAI